MGSKPSCEHIRLHDGPYDRPPHAGPAGGGEVLRFPPLGVSQECHCNRLAVPWFASGLRMVDMSDPWQLEELGYDIPVPDQGQSVTQGMTCLPPWKGCMTSWIVWEAWRCSHGSGSDGKEEGHARSFDRAREVKRRNVTQDRIIPTAITRTPGQQGVEESQKPVLPRRIGAGRGCSHGSLSWTWPAAAHRSHETRQGHPDHPAGRRGGGGPPPPCGKTREMLSSDAAYARPGDRSKRDRHVRYARGYT